METYFVRGKQIYQNNIDIFSDYLTKEDLPVPISWDTNVSNGVMVCISVELYYLEKENQFNNEALVDHQCFFVFQSKPRFLVYLSF